jgi:hypothetical protein
MALTMVWSPVIAAVVIALLFTLVLVSLLGWRRPGAMQTESIVTSGVFFFMILVLATWAAGSWMAPRGPMAFGVPWLAWMGVAFVVTLIVGAVTQPWDRQRSRRALPTPSAGSASGAVENEMVGVGFGLAFWALVVLLLLVALAGSYDRL